MTSQVRWWAGGSGSMALSPPLCLPVSLNWMLAPGAPGTIGSDRTTTQETLEKSDACRFVTGVKKNNFSR